MGPIARRSVTSLFVVLLLPAAAFAQGTITGVVRDASGAVLPGVTVEAASPVLIEKVRSVLTDSTGQYRIVDLRPGTYAVTFTLPGFTTVKRDGIELTGDFVASVNADLRVGSLEETVTVTGESPIVDVQSARVQTVLDRDVLTAIPSSRGANGIQALIPGLIVGWPTATPAASPAAAAAWPASSTAPAPPIPGRSTTASTPGGRAPTRTPPSRTWRARRRRC